MGLFEHPYIDESQVQRVLDTPEHRQLARIAAQRSAVLFRNEASCSHSRCIGQIARRDRPLATRNKTS